MSNILSDWVKKNVQKPEKGELAYFFGRWKSGVAELKVNGIRVFLWSGLGGKRFLVTKHNGVYTEHDLPDLFRELVVAPQTIVDCELVRETSTLFCFDLLYHNNVDVRAKPLHERKLLLEEAVKPSRHVVFLKHVVVSSSQEAQEIYDSMVSQGNEGIVLKADVAYGVKGSWLKLRNTETEDVFVTKLVETKTTKETGEFVTYEVAQYENGSLQVLGKVSSALSIVDRALIKVGSVLEVRFNHVDGERVFPGTIMRVRNDKIASECEASGKKNAQN